MKRINVILVALLSCLLFVGCNKDRDKEIIGKWKLTKLVVDTAIIDGRFQQFEIGYLNNNIIYEFHRNNKLVVTSSISGNSQKSKYSYDCTMPKVDCYTPPLPPLNLQIEGENCLLYLSEDGTTMDMRIESSNPKKQIDETDIVIIEQKTLYGWCKKFIKIK